jgi:hypothetical protein
LITAFVGLSAGGFETGLKQVTYSVVSAAIKAAKPVRIPGKVAKNEGLPSGILIDI